MVTDERAEVMSYARDALDFYVRHLILDKKGFRNRRIDGVTSLPDALNKSLDEFIFSM